MKTTRSFSRMLTIGVLVAILAILATLPLIAARGLDDAGVRRARSAQAELISLESTYVGQVKLNWAAPGLYSDTLTAPTGTLPELGGIDLGFLLHCEQNSLSGYVDLNTTLVFTGEHTITTTQAITTPLAVGPAVHGTCGGANAQLESERFSYLTGAGQRVMRQFRLMGTRVNSTMFTGEYRETLWGYGLQPLTIVGEFNLDLMSGENIALPHHIYLPLVLSKG